MKLKSIFSVFAFAIILSCLLGACKKKAATPTNNNNNNNTASFSYTLTNSGVNTTYTADSAFWTTGAWGTGVRAFKGGNMILEINWATQNNTSVGAKTLGMAVDFTYITGVDFYTPVADDTLNVTAFSSNLMSGNFDVPVTSSTGPLTLTNVSGTFSNIPQD